MLRAVFAAATIAAAGRTDTLTTLITTPIASALPTAVMVSTGASVSAGRVHMGDASIDR